jgi:hypothetical protein
MRERIPYLNHFYSQCGVYQFGKDQAKALIFQKYDVVYHELRSEEEFHKALDSPVPPKAVIINHHPATLPFINRELLLSKKGTKFLIMVHDNFIDFGDEFFYLFPDPTYKSPIPNRFGIDRVVPQYYPTIGVRQGTIGSFGFAFGQKDYVNLAGYILSELPAATIRFHIPASTFGGDPHGSYAAQIAQQCRAAYPHADFEINHKYLFEQELVDWLGQNELNIFNYLPGRATSGCASVIDWAIAARRPFGVNKSIMFRHVWQDYPELIIRENTLPGIISKGDGAVMELHKKWSPKNFRTQMREILNEAIRASR